MKTAIVAFTLGTISLCASAQDQPSSSPGAAKGPNGEPAEKRDQRPGEDERLARLKRELVELQNAGKYEEAQRVTREFQAIERRQAHAKDRPYDEPKKRADGAQPDDRGRKPAQEGAERLRHLQEAIHHLHAAGLHEPARDLENAAGKLRETFERQSREAREHEAHAHAADGEPRGREGAEGRRPEVAANAAPMREMHRQLQEMREQMQKMARELQEMREQSRRQ